MTLSSKPPWTFTASLLTVITCLQLNLPLYAMTPANQFFPTGPQASLETAIRADDAAAIARALNEGASVNAVGKFSVTPLMVAVDTQSLRAVQAPAPRPTRGRRTATARSASP